MSSQVSSGFRSVSGRATRMRSLLKIADSAAMSSSTAAAAISSRLPVHFVVTSSSSTHHHQQQQHRCYLSSTTRTASDALCFHRVNRNGFAIAKSSFSLLPSLLTTAVVETRTPAGEGATRRCFSTRPYRRAWSSAATMQATSTSLDDPALMIPAELQALASQRPTPLRLADMYKYGQSSDKEQRLRNAQFLHRELPIRIAQRAVDLLTLPHGLNKAQPIRKVAQMYLDYLEKLQDLPSPTTLELEDKFTDLLQGFVLDRASIPESIAHGIAAWSEDQGSKGHKVQEDERLQEMEDALYRFFTARTGLRFLTEHHVLSCDRESARVLRQHTFLFPHGPDDEFRGCIQTNVDILAETQKVAELVRQQTMDFYGMCPDIQIVDCLNKESLSGSNKDFTYVPHHLHYMLAELLKNSCRATVEQFIKSEMRGSLAEDDGGEETKAELFPIRAVIAQGEEDVTIKIADKGGGIPRSRMSKIWKFGHSGRSGENDCFPQSSTLEASAAKESSQFNSDVAAGAKIRGFGLPLARIYARYFGGELSLKSMEGYGVDVYLHLPRLGFGCENLPLRVRDSPGELDSMPSQKIKYHTVETTTPQKRRR